VKIQWLTTAPNPRSPATGFDAGQRGWRLHAVNADNDDTFLGIGPRAAACGLRPAYGWGLDLFIEAKCATCLRKLGMN
jgi:hypothetical protein